MIIECKSSFPKHSGILRQLDKIYQLNSSIIVTSNKYIKKS